MRCPPSFLIQPGMVETGESSRVHPSSLETRLKLTTFPPRSPEFSLTRFRGDKASADAVYKGVQPRTSFFPPFFPASTCCLSKPDSTRSTLPLFLVVAQDVAEVRLIRSLLLLTLELRLTCLTPLATHRRSSGSRFVPNTSRSPRFVWSSAFASVSHLFL